MRWVLLAVLLAATLGGCFEKGEQNEAAPLDEEEGGPPDGRDANGTDNGTRGNGTRDDGNGTAPPPMQGLSVELTANQTNGSAPLNVTFYLNVTGSQGNPVHYTLDFGDGNSTNGTIMPGSGTGAGEGGNGTGGTGSGSPSGNGTGNQTGQGGGNQTEGNGTGSFGGPQGTHAFRTVSVNHSYNWTGPYNVTVNATQGQQSANATLNVTVEPQREVVFEDSVLCGPGVLFVSGSISDGEHELQVRPGQSNLTVTLEYPDSFGNDLDLRITDPDGKETESFESGPEPPISFDRPMEGTWTVEVLAFSCTVSEDYTVTATFA